MNENKSLAIVPKTMPEMQSLAEVLAKSTLIPEALRNKAPDIIVQLLAGAELGLSPMAAIRGVHVIQGKAILSADTMVALCLGSGLCEYFQVEAETETSVTYVCKRKGAPQPQRYTWSDEDTKAAGLNTKDTWRLFKKQMRRARCKSILARDSFPDLLAGVYDGDSGEIADSRAPRFEPEAVDAEVVGEMKMSAIERIWSAGDPNALKALVPELAKLADKDRAEARKAYDTKMRSFDGPAATIPAAEPAA